MKIQRKPSCLCVMVAGAAGAGKTTFIKTLLGNKEDGAVPEAKERRERSDFNVTTSEVGSGPIKKRIVVIDTEGYGRVCGYRDKFGKVSEYITEQFNKCLLEETKIHRSPEFEDTRVHCVLYFVSPSSSGVKDSDIEYLREIHDKCNIIPVISKADGYSKEELAKIKENVKTSLRLHRIETFECGSVEDNPKVVYLEPFSVVGASGCHQVDGKSVWGRKYSWGVVDVENPEHCDVYCLRSILFGSAWDDLKELTNGYFYERYRKNALRGIEGVMEAVGAEAEAEAVQKAVRTEK